MAVEDYLEPEVAVAAAVTAVIASPRVRKVLRQGAVWGLAGAITAGEALGRLARGIGKGVHQAAIESAAMGNQIATTTAEKGRPSGRTQYDEAARPSPAMGKGS